MRPSQSAAISDLPRGYRGAQRQGMGAGLAGVFEQDAANLPQVAKGIKASKKGALTFSNYQEVRIRHFHQTLDKYINGEI